MKKLASAESKRVRRSATGSVSKTPPRSKPKGKSARLGPARTGAAWKVTGLLPEQCPAPDTVAVRFKLYRPQALEVFVAGSFNDWQPRATPLLPLLDGEWAVELMLKPGRYEYRYVVDGQWIDDPMAPRFVANPFRGLNSVMEVRLSA